MEHISGIIKRVMSDIKVEDKADPEADMSKDTCPCGTKAKQRPRCRKYRYRHKCPHGNWCAFGHRLVGWHAVSNIHCRECEKERVAKRLANDEGYQRYQQRKRG